ncbi:MAG: ribbon-helix-helix protein, CopG family [Spirochaetales bacterium]|nr:ribbon-helix-helix protein, CopG family [Spirochaetales bacterium]
MGETIRFGVSMDSDLVELLDKMTREKGHPNRSETLRSLVRQELINTYAGDEDYSVIGTLTLLYHYGTGIPKVSIAPYPSVRINANLQLHADRDVCIKVLIIQGKGKEVHAWADKLLSSRKVIGKLTIAATNELKKELIKQK